jgi:subtilisin-like proprotein convertase family protein
MMFADTKDQPVRRPRAPRRTLVVRASLLAVMSCLTLGLTVAEPLVAAKSNSKQTEEEKKGGKTITRTFSSPNAVVINDNTQADPYPSAIQVSGIKKGKVKDVNVTLRGYNHGFPDNVDVMLVAPDGSSTVLMSDSGGATDASSLTLTFDDQATGTTPDGSTIESGTFKPVNYGAAVDNFPSLGAAPTTVSLAELNGGNPNGEWKLYVVDDTATSVGAFSGGWDLELTAKLAKKKKHGHDDKK